MAMGPMLLYVSVVLVVLVVWVGSMRSVTVRVVVAMRMIVVMVRMRAVCGVVVGMACHGREGSAAG